MKRVTILLVSAIFLLGYVNAQENINTQEEVPVKKSNDEFKTIFSGKSVGGYGAFGIGYTQIEGRDGVSFDSRAGVVLGHSLALGVSGAGFVNTYEYVQAENVRVSLAGGYGGIFAEVFILPRFPVHVSFPVTAGIGAVSATSWDETDVESSSTVLDVSTFMIVEPGVELEFNLLEWFRMSAFYSYRFTTELDLDELYGSPFGLDNHVMGLRFKFGKF